MDWKTLKSEYLISNKWVKLRKDQVVLPSGKEIDDFFVIERPNLIHVIAITKEGLFVLEKQYRYAIHQECYEICAGMIEEGETPLEAAQRELLEETGYSGGTWKELGKMSIDPSNMTDISYSFVAFGVEKVTEQRLDETEVIDVQLFTKDEVLKLMLEEKIISGLMLAPLWKYFSNNK